VVLPRLSPDRVVHRKPKETLAISGAGLSSYQRAWLLGHPERTEAWLREKLQDGFEVHHLDADRKNDDPNNLVLLERGDHHALHGKKLKHIVRESTAQFDRTAYQRKYMRRWRAAKKDGSHGQAEDRTSLHPGKP
jgi:hypothetical protein